VLTMTVRYKSATLDEFIEHHSYDVSRGGMFIKTPSPFPPGTLLKFEVKIAADQKVIQGVGRVVWKREHETTADARPAGMGVKFIKIDDASRKVIDTLVESRGDASSAYEAGGGDTGQVPAAAASAGGKPAATPGEAPKAPNLRKATMIGLGAMNPLNRPQVAPSAQKPVASFFPETNSEADMPAPEDRTVMKQAAELLQDALREAGGSMAEVGSSSKYDEPPAKPAAAKSAVSDATPAVPSTLGSESPRSVSPAIAAKVESDRPAASVKPAAASVKPAAASVKPAAASVKPAAASVKPAAASTTKATLPASSRKVAASVSNRRVSVPAVTQVASSSGGGGGRVVVIALVIAATGGLVWAFSSAKPPEPQPAETAEPALSAAPSAAPVDTASAAPPESAAPAESAAPPASASAAPAENAAPAASAAPVVTTPPIAVPAPAPPTVVPTPEPPAPKPKPAEPAGDNPY
ncbi:MAG: TIGR02266 family protein, partial [Polyangiaceae bacterium]